jgi:dipeptidyl aminopeptidase/acylaminoacyl peptidase
MGAMLAVIFAAEYSYIKAVVAVSPPAFIGSSGYFKTEIPNWEKAGKLEIENSKGELLKVPDSFLRESRKYSALTSAKSIKQPILTMVGTADTIVSPEDSKQISDAISGEKKFLEIPEMTHEYADEPENLKKVNEETKKFFDEYLKK